MGKIDGILKETAHRPYKIPDGNWDFYQEWKQVLLFHWTIPENIIKPLIPKGLELDFFDEKTYVSLVPFSVKSIRPRMLPAISAISDFHEVNLRAYIIKDGIPGIYFLSIEAEKRMSAFISRTFSGLPYEHALISRSDGRYQSANPFRKFSLQLEYTISDLIPNKTPLDKWLTERYALYLENHSKLYRFDVHHKEWEIRNVEMKKLQVDYKFTGFNLSDRQPDSIHYSDGVEVIAWNKIRIR